MNRFIMHLCNKNLLITTLILDKKDGRSWDWGKDLGSIGKIGNPYLERTFTIYVYTHTHAHTCTLVYVSVYVSMSKYVYMNMYMFV